MLNCVLCFEEHHSGCTISCPHQQCLRVLTSLRPQHLLLSVFLITAILGVKWSGHRFKKPSGVPPLHSVGFIIIIIIIIILWCWV
jgi:hypothetical protein